MPLFVDVVPLDVDGEVALGGLARIDNSLVSATGGAVVRRFVNMNLVMSMK